MRAFQEKRRLRRIIFSTPSVFLMFLLAVSALTASSKETFRAWQAHREREKVEMEYRELEAKKNEIESRIQTLESPEGLEKEAKERFNVKKPGEEVLIFISPRFVSSSSVNEDGGDFFEFFRKILGL